MLQKHISHSVVGSGKLSARPTEQRRIRSIVITSLCPFELLHCKKSLLPATDSWSD